MKQDQNYYKPVDEYKHSLVFSNSEQETFDTSIHEQLKFL